jgi:hypothetical protein
MSRFKQTRTITPGCPRCGEKRTVEVIIQARPTPTRKGTLASRSRGYCYECAEEVFKRLEVILDETKGSLRDS